MKSEVTPSLTALLETAQHVFDCHADGNWHTYKGSFASQLASLMLEAPLLTQTLLGSGDRLTKMLVYRALELLQVTYRRIEEGEMNRYREVRLKALKNAPEAFGTSYTEAIQRSDARWQHQADTSAMGADRATFFALDGDRVIGLAALYRVADSTRGEMIQVWVDPAFRGGLVIVRLLDRLYQWARANRYDRIEAEVRSNNVRATHFYLRHGFEAWRGQEVIQLAIDVVPAGRLIRMMGPVDASLDTN